MNTEPPRAPPGVSPDKKLYNVHCFAVLRFKVENIPAGSPREAIDIAATELWPKLESHFCDDSGEFAEEFSHYLVDRVGDENYDQSFWFHGSQDPLLCYLHQFVAWCDKHPDNLDPELAALAGTVRDQLACVA